MRLFGTDGIRGKPNKSPLTPQEIARIGQSFARSIGKAPRILACRDTRESGAMIQAAVTAGLASAGADVFDAGVLNTPAAAYIAKAMKMDAAVVISASHNPADENGIKFFTGSGAKLTEKQEAEIEQAYFSNKGMSASKTGLVHNFIGAGTRYIDFARQAFGDSVKGINAVIDCSNGAAYLVAPRIMDELGIKVKAISAEPDGFNINRECGSEHPEKLRQAVLKAGADIGVAFDGDADRAMLIDEEGTILSGDQLIGIAAIHMAKKKTLANSRVIVTHYSNYGLEETLKKYSIGTIRCEVGDQKVAAAMAAHGCNLGGEQSGHIIFSDIMPTGDGIITALQMMRIMKSEGKKLSELARIIEKLPQAIVSIPVREKKEIEGLRLAQSISEAEKLLEGSGRVYVRYSGTQSLLRIMVEGKNEKQINKIAQELARLAKSELG
ncbi:phosphoglucosamine mutase [Candidatus Woesearchaeota archaeon]|nr:phosphoglucosamine mutase [Candidatus Woesearchaeota archaeon]